MRVITGTARGRKLKTPAGFDIRPTTDQVKEAIFNICQFDVEGRRVLDMFGGTGQLGIEAKKNFREMQPGDVYQTFADVEELQRDFGFRPDTRIEVGISKFVEWYKKYDQVEF